MLSLTPPNHKKMTKYITHPGIGRIASGEQREVNGDYKQQFEYILSDDQVAFVVKSPSYRDLPSYVAVVLVKGAFTYDSGGNLVTTGRASSITTYRYNYESQREVIDSWRFSSPGLLIDPSASTVLTAEDAGGVLTSFYSSTPDIQIYNDFSLNDASAYKYFPASHDRSDLQGFPGSSSFPVGWWNEPFDLKLDSGDGIAHTYKLTGSAKTADLLSFTHAPSFGKETADTITNFNPKEKDKLQIQLSQFGPDAAGTFKIAKKAKALTKALATSTDFIYLKSTGELYYNENGSAAGYGLGGVFAVLEGRPNFGAKNIGFI